MTVKDVRASLYEMLIPEAQNITEEELGLANFWFDLHMDERKVQLLITNLERTHRVMITTEVQESLKMKNTVGTLLNSANGHLIDLDET